MSYPIGARFEYKSKYSNDIIVGYIKEVGVGYYTPGMNKYVVSLLYAYWAQIFFH